jgi:twinkle protein
LSFVKLHQPCPDCGSSDALSINDDGSAFCFSCGERFSSRKYNALLGESPTGDIEINLIEKEPITFAEEGEYVPLRDRGISEETAKKYGVRCILDSGGNITKHLYPYYKDKEIVAYKERVLGSTGKQNFFSKGAIGSAGLFGEQMFQAGGKYVTLVEGECDAMAAYELLGSKWPVLSVRSGAQGAERDVKASLEYLESFDTVIINFDEDKVGRESARRVARLLKPSKAKIMSLPEGFKDANDMLNKHDHKGYVAAWWASKTYTPSGVLSVSENKEKYKNRERKQSFPYPWQGLNDKLEGLRQGELVTLTGGTGLGKSSVTRELEHWLVKTTSDNVGIIALEETFNRTVDGILSIEANAKLHIDRIRDQYTEEELDTFFDIMYDGDNNNRVWIHAHFGANDIDSIFSKLRFMIVGCGCKWVVIDHLHMMVSTTIEGDARRGLDAIMHRIRTLVEETGAGIILVSHLRRVDGNKGHENGIETGLSHLRGSQSIAQLSDCVISLERNQQSDDPLEASTTRVRILKSRYTGDVGLATHLVFDNETGRLSEVDGDDISNSNDEDKELALEFD